MMLPTSAVPRLDAGTWKCHRPFSHCFLRRKMNKDGDDEDREKPSRPPGGQKPPRTRPTHIGDTVYKSDSSAEQSDVATDMNDTSLKARLARVNSMKGKTYSLPAGFAAARKDALEMIGMVRSSVGQLSRGEGTEVSEADHGKLSQVMCMQAKALGGACSQMALEHGSPEELLLTLTHSFHMLCCLTQACISLLEGLSDEDRRRREVVAKVDEVVMNYVCLLKAAEEASGSSTNDQSVNALTHHSAIMSATVDALTHSLKTLLNK